MTSTPTVGCAVWYIVDYGGTVLRKWPPVNLQPNPRELATSKSRKSRGLLLGRGFGLPIKGGAKPPSALAAQAHSQLLVAPGAPPPDFHELRLRWTGPRAVSSSHCGCNEQRQAWSSRDGGGPMHGTMRRWRRLDEGHRIIRPGS